MRLSVDYMDLDTLFEQYQEKAPDCEKLTRNEVKQFEAIFHKLAEISNGGWIGVKDRLPENNRFVLVCNDDGHMMVAQYIEETAQWQYKYTNYDVDVWDDEEQGPVCWWAELPEPPKEEEK